MSGMGERQDGWLVIALYGHRVRVGTVYEWADKSRKEVFDVSASEFDLETVRVQPLVGGS